MYKKNIMKKSLQVLEESTLIKKIMSYKMTQVENDVSVSFVHKKPEIPIKYNLGTIPYL